MTAPNTTPGGTYIPGMATETTLDEIMELNAPEAEVTTPTVPADPASFRVDGDSVPQSLRGLSAAQITERAARLEEALRISEEARLSSKSVPAPAQPATPVNPQPTGFTPEKIRELYENDPVEAMAAMAYMAEQRANQRFEERLRGLNTSVSNSVSAQVRTQFKEDFDILGKEIEETAAQIAPEALANPAVWADLISYVRGKNIDKIVEHKLKQRGDDSQIPSRSAVQDAQLTSLPPRVGQPPRAPTRDDNYGLDATQLRICETMGLTPAEYKRNMI
jgi:hypothetical protein